MTVSVQLASAMCSGIAAVTSFGCLKRLFQIRWTLAA